jgi:hypothetical protein
MSDQELGEWVHALVTLKEPESIFLDYKEAIGTDSRSNKREIAKDVSSFANERGGVVLYGIPQIEENGEPVPADVDDIGMDPLPGLPEVIENILVDALTPRLPELRVREVPLVNLPHKVVYLVWHPESWEAPHMIHTYGEHRYYKRGNFRAVPMKEGEIERLYLRRQARRTLADQFLKESDFGESLFSMDRPLLRLVVCPAFPFEDRVSFSHGVMRTWLIRNTPGRGSDWLPFIQGARFASRSIGPQGQIKYREEFRLFRNGAASVCSDYPEVAAGTISGLRFLERLRAFFDFARRFYEQIAITGDTLIDVAFFNMKGVEFLAGVSHTLHSDEYQWHSHTLQFRVATSAVDLLTEDSRRVLERHIMDRLTQCFGEWTIPGYFQ